MKEFNSEHEYGTVLQDRVRSQSRVRLAVFLVAGVHVVGLLAFLMIVGCKRTEEPQTTEEPLVPPMPPTVVTSTPVMPPMPETNTNMGAFLPPIGPEEPSSGLGPQPIPGPETNQPVAQATTEYTVVPGDTFYGIAKKFGVSIKAIQSANPGVDPRRLRVGQKLIIPPPEPPGLDSGTGARTGVQETGSEVIYTVQSGDTLTRIAARYGVTVKAIKSANNLTTDRIKVGQKLRIPVKNTTERLGVIPSVQPPPVVTASPPVMPSELGLPVNQNTNQ